MNDDDADAALRRRYYERMSAAAVAVRIAAILAAVWLALRIAATVAAWVRFAG